MNKLKHRRHMTMYRAAFIWDVDANKFIFDFFGETSIKFESTRLSFLLSIINFREPMVRMFGIGLNSCSFKSISLFDSSLYSIENS